MADRTIFRMIFDALQFHFVEKVGGGGDKIKIPIKIQTGLIWMN